MMNIFLLRRRRVWGDQGRQEKHQRRKVCGNAFKHNAHIMHSNEHTQVPRREDLNEEFDLSVDVTVCIIYSSSAK